MPYLNPDHYPTYSSLEIRPNGILVHINQGLKNFTWPIPYYQLSVYHTEHITIHGQGEFIRFRKEDKTQYPFLQKIIREKAEWAAQYDPELP